MDRICVFCGANLGASPRYRFMAETMGQVLVHRGLGLVYGGGNVGLMGIIADAVLKAGGEVVGVIPEFLVAKEIAHTGLTRLHVVTSMHERKAMMADLADGFIALPGGCGTLEEFCEVLTWGNLGLHQKPMGLLNIDGYYDPLLQWFDRAVADQFITTESRSIVLEATEPTSLLDQLLAYQPRFIDKWLELPEKL